ncbi:hypothetical protein CBS101457_006283 [Exobasidium rhododendri]|nr:hypothetical protein CBS101457_006283 [Exobasidium rhododendri]
MTNRELNEADSHSKDGQESLRLAASANPPPYEEGVRSAPVALKKPDHSIPEDFNHIVIPPPEPFPDERTVDIRVDDELTSSNQEEEDQLPSVRHSFLTPYRAIRDAATSPYTARYQITGFDSIELKASSRSAGGRSSSVSEITSHEEVLNSIPPASAPAAPVAVEGPSFPPLTSEDMWEALPVRNAIFLADMMEWIVVAPEGDVRIDGKSDVSPSPISSLDSPVPLWKNEGTTEIPVRLQKKPIITLVQSNEGVQSDLEPLESFEWWRSSKGHSLLLSKEGSLPSVVPVELMETLRRERIANPRPGQTGEIQFRDAVTTLIKVVGNAANGEVRALAVTGKTITTKLGVDDISRHILEVLGFSGDGKPDVSGLFPLIKPPDMSQFKWQLKLRRAWLEISLWFQHKIKESAKNSLKSPEIVPSMPLLPRCTTAMDHLALCFGYDPTSQVMDRKEFLPEKALDAFEFLGSDSNSSEDVVEACYLANTHDLPLRGKLPFFAALQTVGQYFRDTESELIQTRLGLEKSRGLFSEQDLRSAFAKFGIDITSLEQSHEISTEFVISVYLGAVEQAAAKKDEVQVFKDALEVISMSRGNPKELEDRIAAPVEVSLDKAYEIIGATPDIDDEFVSSLFSLVFSDGSKSAEECTEAIRVIAEARKSQALKKVYRSAIGEAEEWEAPDLEKPIGLNNIGNTCYLNSVLQYFFAIRQLREHVLLLLNNKEDGHLLSSSSSQNGSIRVGGRQVSDREIERSHRFVKQLAQLFSNMITSPASAVTPERELAYLALVSSRVEEISEVATVALEEEVLEKKHSLPPLDGQEVLMQKPVLNPASSIDTVLVDEPSSILPAGDDNDAHKSNASRNNSAMHASSASSSMVVHNESLPENTVPTEDGFTTPPLPFSSEAPPLPPRSKVSASIDTNREAGQHRNSMMQLGAQQDVSECLDNVMFQIEVALVANDQDEQAKRDEVGVEDLKLESSMEDGGEWIENDDLLRRLFLGRTLQRLESAAEGREERNGARPSVHSKKEVFTILPIDVVEEGRNIYDGLDGFFDEEILIGSSGESIRRTVTLIDAPVVLQIQLQRVQFDRIKGAYKSQAHLEVGETLFMDRYLDFDPLDEEDAKRLEKRKRAREARRRIEELRARNRALEPEKVPISKSLQRTSDYLTSLESIKSVLFSTVRGEDDGEEEKKSGGEERAASEEGGAREEGSKIEELFDPGFSEFLNQEAARVDAELKAIEEEIIRLKNLVEELWQDEKRYEYVLTSVFMHRGEASHGHYFLNQRKVTQGETDLSLSLSNVWYKYNDQTITEINWSEVHRDQSGATPYLLCWIRKDKLNHFDSLCRHYETSAPTAAEGAGDFESSSSSTVIYKSSSQQPADVVMSEITPPVS